MISVTDVQETHPPTAGAASAYSPPPDPDVKMSDPRAAVRLPRDRAAVLLTDCGYPITASRLAKMAVEGDGPPFELWGRTVVYRPVQLIVWAQNRGSADAPATDRRAQLASTPINANADYTIAQVLAWASMSSSEFYRRVAAGKGPVIHKRGRKSLVRGSDFLAWRDALA